MLKVDILQTTCIYTVLEIRIRNWLAVLLKIAYLTGY